MDLEVRIEATPEWRDWRDHPQTQVFLHWLNQTVKQHQESWVRREFESDNGHSWITKNAAALARAAMCAEIEDLIRNLEPISKTEEKKDVE